MPRKGINTKHGRNETTGNTQRPDPLGAASAHASTGRGGYAHPVQSRKQKRKRKQPVGAGAPRPGALRPGANSHTENEPSPHPTSTGDVQPAGLEASQPAAQGGSLEWQAAAAKKSLEVLTITEST